jgi:SRSO17 transposase
MVADDWPISEPEPTKYCLSPLPEDTPVEHLIQLAKMLWRIEHDYQHIKQELSLGHFEGWGWGGFHRHATLCIAAYGFLVARRLVQGGSKKTSARLQIDCADPIASRSR